MNNAYIDHLKKLRDQYWTRSPPYNNLALPASIWQSLRGPTHPTIEQILSSTNEPTWTAFCATLGWHMATTDRRIVIQRERAKPEPAQYDRNGHSQTTFPQWVEIEYIFTATGVHRLTRTIYYIGQIGHGGNRKTTIIETDTKNNSPPKVRWPNKKEIKLIKGVIDHYRSHNGKLRQGWKTAATCSLKHGYLCLTPSTSKRSPTGLEYKKLMAVINQYIKKTGY